MRTTAASLSLIAVLFAAAAHLNAQATRTWVSGVGDDANPCSRTAPCKTFAGAISKTAAGGEIDVLDPGGFGAVTITKSLIISGGGNTAGVLVSGTNGITVAAGSTDTVVLKGLDINGLGLSSANTAGIDGIQFLSGQKLVVTDCLIMGFAHRGISIESSTDGAQAFISNTILAGQTNNGIVVNPASVNNVLVLDHVQVVHSTALGLAVNPGGRADISNSTFSFNSGAGVWATGPVALSLDSTQLTDNGTGLVLLSGATVRLSNVNVAGNAIGFNTAGGILNSFGNNHTTGNLDGVQPTVNTHLSPL